MANLKEIRTRISSVTSTRQITSAMKMVAAAKLRKAQDAITQLRPYAEKLSEILEAIADSVKEGEDNPFVHERETERVLLVVISSNKGLCGNFNTTIIKETLAIANNQYLSQRKSGGLDLLIIGKKAEDFFKKRDYNIVEVHNDILDKIRYEDVAKLAESIMEKFVEGLYDRVELIYNQFINAAVQKVNVEQYLPLRVEDPAKEPVMTTFTDYIFEPTKKQLVKELVPRSLKLQLHKAIIDSNASEQGARMTAMHKATDNATELLKDLRLDYNKARQANITNEILEIVSGADAMEN